MYNSTVQILRNTFTAVVDFLNNNNLSCLRKS